MNEPSSQEQNDPSSVKVDLRIARPSKKRLLIVLGAALGLILLFGVFMIVRSYTFATSSIIEKDEQTNFFGQIQRIIDNDVDKLKGEEEDQINVLLLGSGGSNHPGGSLTDTNMVLSIKPSTHQAAFISIPRDFQIPTYLDSDPEHTYPYYRKINYAVFHGGVEFAKETVSNVLGLDIHYYAEVDFKAFRDIIDAIGGIEVDVPTAFSDYQYPDYNYGYNPISFEAGVQTMDGETALQYARSRKGNNGEGGDFRRAARQQIILEAARDKLLSASTILSPTKITALLDSLGDNISTDIELWEMSRFAKLVEDIGTENMENLVIDQAETELLIVGDYPSGAYGLEPAAGIDDYSEIQAYVASAFERPQKEVSEDEEVVTEDTVEVAEEEPVVVAQQEPKPDIDAAVAELPVIAVQNGYAVTGLAARIAGDLRAENLTVQGVANANTDIASTTILYDLSGGAMPETLAWLEDYFSLDARKATRPSTSGVSASTDLDESTINMVALPDNADFLLLIGSDFEIGG